MFRKFISQTLILLFLAACPHVFAQERGVGVRVKTAGGQTREISLYKGSYALVIGEANYRFWDVLSGVKSDVDEVAKVLSSQFVVETEMNLTGREIKQRIEKFISDYGYEAENRLLIYYAGHGHTLKSATGERERGYIVPIDAPDPDKDELGFKRIAIDMDTIQNYAKQIEAKHTLFLFDSCFSGKLVTRAKITVPPYIQEQATRPTRQFITSGAANQTVPDESIFRRAFVRGLHGEADRNGDGFILGSELADYLKEQVTNYSNRIQTPQYGKINDIDLNVGDFVFLLASNSPANTVAVQPDAKTADDILWEEVSRRNTLNDYRMYLIEYPVGKYAAVARLRIRDLEAGSAAAGYKNPKAGMTLERPLGGGLSMKFMGIPAGSFLMGSPMSEKDRGSDEGPQRTVTIGSGFWMSKYEVTQEEYEAVTGTNPSNFKGCPKCPVENVSWDDAKVFIAKLNAKNDGFIYSLPSEAEWEYAARAGTTGAFGIGDGNSLSSSQANFDGNTPYGSAAKGPDLKKTTPAGSYLSNAWGLYDMHGNVWEWCEDIYKDSYSRVLRGGSWVNGGLSLRSARRSWYGAAYRSSYYGIRLVLRQN